MAALRTRIYSKLDIAYVGGLSMSVWLYQAWGVCHLHLGLGRICLYCMHRGWSPSLVFVAVPAYSNMSLGWLSFAFTDRCRLCSVPICVDCCEAGTPRAQGHLAFYLQATLLKPAVHLYLSLSTHISSLLGCKVYCHFEHTVAARCIWWN